MGNRNKAKAALKREREKRQKQMEDAALQRKWEKIASQTGGFARSVPKKPLVRSNLDKPRIIRESDLQKIGKEGRYEDYIVEPAKAKERLSPEMQEREDRAKTEAAVKAMRIAPLFNKGAYQYVTDGEMKDFLKGKSRRRG